MSNEREVFTKAREISDAGERSRYLDEVCADDTALRERLAEMLRFSENTDSFLNEDALQRPHHYDSLYASGSVIGRYKLLEEIGEGGCGVVFMADQRKPVRRRVALKIVKPGMDTKEVLARFDAERQALALMNHPNIASIFDGGQTSFGHPYFVMELVNGPPITEFCDARKMDVANRLELFANVCNAVHHAHQKGVIHRDIKPSNLLVTLHDGQPVPKVIDFGIAKAIDRELTERTLFTRFGRLVGTPAYMSPEQAERSGRDIDIRTDVYSLGIVLYELLTGETPLSEKLIGNTSLEELQHLICKEQPTTPSAHVSTFNEKKASEVSGVRSISQRELCRMTRGELDWITMRALEKDRSRRYASAAAFADDISNYLAGRPVAAAPPTTAYRIQQFTRRHAKLLGTLATVFVLMSVALALTSFNLLWSRRMNEQLSAANETAEANAYAADVRFAMEHGDRTEIVDRYINRRELSGWELRWLWQLDRVNHSRDTLPPHDGSFVLDVDISSNDNYLAIASHGGKVDIWKLPEFTLLKSIADQQIMRVEFTPNEEYCVYSRITGEIVFVRMSDFKTEQMQARHGLYSLSFSSDGLMAGFVTNRVPGDGAFVNVWKVHSKQQQPGFPIEVAESSGGHKGVVRFSPDNRFIAIGETDGRVRIVSRDGSEIWNVSPESVDESSWRNSNGVTAMAFTRNGELLLTGAGYKDHEIKIWDAVKGTLIDRFRDHTSYLTGIVVLADGRVVSTDNNGEVLVWDVASRHLAYRLRSPQRIRASDVNGDGTMIVTGGGDETIQLWDLQPAQDNSYLTLSGLVNESSSAMGRSKHAVAEFLPDSNSVAAVNKNGSVVVIDCESFEYRTISELGESNVSAAGSADGQSLAVTDNEGKVRVWNLASGSTSLVSHDHARGLTAHALSRSTLITNDRRANVKREPWQCQIWDMSSDGSPRMRRSRVFQGGLLVACPKKSLVAVEGGPSDTKTITVWNYETDSIVTLQAPPGVAEVLAFSSDGRWFAAGATRTTVWDTTDWSVKNVIPQLTHGIAFSPDGRRLALGTGGGVRLWDTKTNRHLGELKADGTLFRTAFSPDGNRILATTLEGHVHLWTAPSWTAIDEERSASK